MTLEEAKKILEEEGFKLGGPGKPGVISEAFAEYESPEICEAMQIVCSAGFQLAMLAGVFDERKERLKKEYEKNTKAPGPVEEQPKENGLKAATDAFILQANEIMRLKKKNAELLEAIDKMKEGNPALKESASQFNDALLDEQSKKIAELTKEKSNLEDKIAVLNACKKHNDKIGRKQIKCLGKEIARLNGIIHDKNAILSDVAEELRLTKIREKNLAELGLKYVGENEKLKKELADYVVDKIDSQALKSAESALAYKDEVIETLDKELAEAKHELSSLKRPFRPDSTEAVVLFANAYAKAEKKHLRCAEWRNDGKEVSVTYILKNGKKSKITLDFTGDEIIFSRTDPDKKPRIPTPEFSEEELMKLQEKVCADIAEEGKDHSTKVVLCGKDVVKKFKENEESVFNFFKRHKETAEELYEVADEALDQLLLFGEVIIKSEE